MNNLSSDLISQCQNELDNYSLFLIKLDFPERLAQSIREKNYVEIDQFFANETSQDGMIFKVLSHFCPVAEIEFIISKRSATDEWEEDGIWHDDGSRILAFSLSLTTEMPSGGVLEIRKKGTLYSSFINTPAYGTMIVFKTGVDGFEHKINAVTKGERLIIAGWCTP